ncbi:MAG TPA: ATP-binding protein [Ilumatobacter sp.]|jgi:anti-sigma regulatory factor (Ser/Thr protein kinase)|nr:ATP-binding protein [Ilumatobacter sp.]
MNGHEDTKITRSGGPPDVVVRFGQDRAAPGVVRRALARLFDGEDDPIAHDALLSASELVSNVVLHTDGGGEIRAWDPKPDVPMRMEVEDSDQSIPEPLPSPNPGHSGGRGLMLLDRLSDAWGVFTTAVGKVVWAEFDRDRRRNRASRVGRSPR